MTEVDLVLALQTSKKYLSRPVPLSFEERKDLIEKAKRVLLDRMRTWSLVEAQEQKLPQNFVLEVGFQHVLHLMDQTIAELNHPPKEFLFSPIGAVAIVTSWQLSFRLAMESILPAFAAGNACLVKVSSRSPASAVFLETLFKEADWPIGAVQVLTGSGSQLGAFMVAHPGVRGVSFTGKTSTAEKIIQSTGSQFKKLQLRGGTKNAALVLPGFDFEKEGAELLRSFLVGQGRLAWGMSRLITLESEAPQLLEFLKKELAKIQFSQGPTDSSPWTLQESSDYKAFLQKAREETARSLIKESSSEEAVADFLINLPNCSDLQQNEIEVPLFPIVTVKYPHEMAKWANNTSFGQLATVWGPRDKALKLAEKLDCSEVWINHWMRSQDESPWGLKSSAFGISSRRAFGPFFSDIKMTS